MGRRSNANTNTNTKSHPSAESPNKPYNGEGRQRSRSKEHRRRRSASPLPKGDRRNRGTDRDGREGRQAHGSAGTTEDAPPAAPDFGLSGKLAAETNTVNGVVLKYAEPAEARKPKDHWRLYVFKDGKDIDMHRVDKASGYLFGRDRKTSPGAIRPYIIDLSSTNGTFLNGDKLPAQRYVELRSKDVIKFGFSTREFVLLSE
ncbi:hypothetical protein GGI12_003780 [Dipsacomyces acuminosporus]|nr:hypothetical protein GGI12_003780 [Dipsacomyces acuminosporus]